MPRTQLVPPKMQGWGLIGLGVATTAYILHVLNQPVRASQERRVASMDVPTKEKFPNVPSVDYPVGHHGAQDQSTGPRQLDPGKTTAAPEGRRL